jgi:radical SAM superfamily enzyme YgiQ (UPF0313 family)
MPDTFYAFRHLNRAVGKKATFPPLGLMTVSSMMPEAWSRRLVDLNVRELTAEDLEWADMVFLSAMNVQEQSVREILARCSEAQKKVVAGGPLFTHEYDRFDGVSHYVLNEAEITFPPFLEDLEAGSAKAMYSSTEYSDISKTPVPDISLINPSQYLYAIVQYSRGCPYMCDFCDVTALYGHRPRVKTFEHMRQELEALMDASNTSTVLFADDNLIGNKRLLKSDFLPKLIEWRRRVDCPFYFATQLTINLVDDEELMQLLLEAGFRHIFIGIETPEEASLDASRKNQNLKRDMMDNVHKLHQRGFIVAGGFIVGFDTDTEDVFDRQIRFIQESGIPLPIVNILKAPPGTELFDRMKREDRLIRDFAFSEGETNISTVMEPEALFDGFAHLVRAVHSPEGSFARIAGFLETYEYPKVKTRIRLPVTWQTVLMAVRLFVYLGITNPRRSKFWAFTGWAIRNKPSFLEPAIFYAALTYQMACTSESILSAVDRERRHRRHLRAA